MTWFSVFLVASLAILPVAEANGQTRPSTTRSGIDETVSVSKGARIEFDQCRGDVFVRTWNRDEVRVQSNRMGRSVLQVAVRNQVVALDYSRGPVADEIDLTVPSWINLRLGGPDCFIDVDGVGGSVALQSVEGSITVKNAGGTIKATTVEGPITCDNSRGPLTLSTVDGHIVVNNADGDIQAESVEGDIVLTSVRSRVVDVATVDGDITFTGAWLPDGSYSLATHDGDVWLVVPDNPNATLAARLFGHPEIDSTIPMPKAGPSRGRRRTFTFGAGAAQIEVETFDGDLKLRRAGELPRTK
jgi:DUF4097 and DUF4098 domain-containing protein YvlB